MNTLNVLVWLGVGVLVTIGVELAFEPIVRVRRALAARGVAGLTPKEDRRAREEALRAFVSAENGDDTLEEESLEMMAGVMSLGDTLVREVMVPRTDVTSIPLDATLDEALDAIIAAGHSRIPVYSGTVDDIRGVLYAKDLLRPFRDRSFDVRIESVMRDPTFVPETKSADDLLHELQGSQIHMAVVIDEHGGTAGIVTIEDLLEVIVGEIQDEYDEEEPTMEQFDAESGVAVFKAAADIDDVNRLLEVDLPSDGDVDTLGGLVFSQLGRVPDVGDRAIFEGVEIEVLDVSGRRVERVRVMRVDQGDDDPDRAEPSRSGDARSSTR